MVLFAGSCHPLALNEPESDPYWERVVSDGSRAGGGAAPAGPAPQRRTSSGPPSWRNGRSSAAAPATSGAWWPRWGGGWSSAPRQRAATPTTKPFLFFFWHLLFKNSVLFINLTYVTYMWLVCNMYININVTQCKEADAWLFFFAFVVWYSEGGRRLKRLNYWCELGVLWSAALV